jgi:hypothetical protein
MSVLSRCIARNVAAAIAALACCAPAAHARWSADPVTVTAAGEPIPIVEGCSDGAHGTFVAWQEGSPTGTLRVQHLLPDGDLDPAWPAAGAIACNVAVSRTEVVALPDRQGGLYLVWKEGVGLYVTRLDAGGAVAAGWPARGRFLGGVFADSPRPGVIEDGAHGIYVAWGTSAGAAVAIHLGPSNTGAGGWPNSARGIGSGDPTYDTMYWPQIAPAPDGGIFSAWASATTDETASPSAWRLRRLTSAGLSFGSFDRPALGSPVQGSLLALGPDGGGGVFLVIGNPVGSDPYNGAILETRLRRIDGDGQTAAGWPVDGTVLSIGPGYYLFSGSSPDYSDAVLPDGRGGALVGAPQYYDHGTNYGFVRCNQDHQWDSWWATQVLLANHEVAVGGVGGLYLGSFYPTGPYGPYQPNAFVAIDQSFSPSAWKGWSEYHSEPVVQWYGDVGLAATDDGGAVLFWSQVRDRVGLFARRFNPGGEVTGVGPGVATAFGLSSVRFVRGEGVRAAVSVPAGHARFDVFDLAGRRIASQAIEPGEREVTIAGTARLPSGLYFGRLVAGADAVAAKVIVAH